MSKQADLNDAIGRRDAARTYDGLMNEIAKRVMVLVDELIGKDDEQKRGAIKEFRKLIELPAYLDAEVSHLAAALSEESDAATQQWTP